MVDPQTSDEKRAVVSEKCDCCGQPATETEFSPYMDDYCDYRTVHRCDITFPRVCVPGPSSPVLGSQ